MAKRKCDYPILHVEHAAAWADWLDAHAGAASGVWLRLARKASALRSLSYAEALDAALCHGWIDGQRLAHDADSWLQKFTPRGRRSTWSKVNREKAEALISDGRMRAGGLAAVEAAKQDGRWDRAYDSPSRATMPDDFAAALARHPAARAFFDGMSGANRYAMLYRIQTAVRPETRARRIEQFVAMLRRGERIH